MSEAETITGMVVSTERMASSKAGNPRYQVLIGDRIVCTAPDCRLGYMIGNYRGKMVRATVRALRGKLILRTIEKVNENDS